jgi:hypothetical protein
VAEEFVESSIAAQHVTSPLRNADDDKTLIKGCEMLGECGDNWKDGDRENETEEGVATRERGVGEYRSSMAGEILLLRMWREGNKYWEWFTAQALSPSVFTQFIFHNQDIYLMPTSCSD